MNIFAKYKQCKEAIAKQKEQRTIPDTPDEKLQKLKDRIKIGFFGLLLSMLLGYVVLYPILNTAELNKRNLDIIQTFNTIPQPSNAIQVKYEVKKRAVTTYVEASYLYNGNQENIKDFFKNELTKCGWLFTKERDGYRELYLEFRKKDYELTIGNIKGQQEWGVLLIKMDRLRKDGF